MNFENMPELQSRYGYFLTLGGMGLLALVLLTLFRLKRWW
jgi:magnesium transporter